MPATAFTDLVVEDGRVVGIAADRDGQTVELRARLRGAARRRRLRAQRRDARGGRPGRRRRSPGWTLGVPENTGDGIRAGMALGAATDLLEDCWWAPGFLPPGRRALLPALGAHRARRDHRRPHGRRWINEGCDYNTFGHRMLAAEAERQAGHPVLVRHVAARSSTRPASPGLRPGDDPAEWVAAGVLVRADTVEELAAALDAPGLVAQVERLERRRGSAASTTSSVAAPTTATSGSCSRSSSATRASPGPHEHPNPSLAPLDAGPVLRRPARAVRPRHQGRAGLRRAGPRPARGPLGHPGPVRVRQHDGVDDGPQLPRARRLHHARHGVRPPGRRGHGAEAARRCPEPRPEHGPRRSRRPGHRRHPRARVGASPTPTRAGGVTSWSAAAPPPDDSDRRRRRLRRPRPAAVAALVRTCRRAARPARRLVNNAGGSPSADAATVSPRFVEQVVALNLLAPFYVRAGRERASCSSRTTAASSSTSAASPPCARRRARRRTPPPRRASRSLTRGLALEWAPKVRVNTVTPGLVRTETADAPTAATPAPSRPPSRWAGWPSRRTSPPHASF